MKAKHEGRSQGPSRRRRTLRPQRPARVRRGHRHPTPDRYPRPRLLPGASVMTAPQTAAKRPPHSRRCSRACLWSGGNTREAAGELAGPQRQTPGRNLGRAVRSHSSDRRTWPSAHREPGPVRGIGRQRPASAACPGPVLWRGVGEWGGRGGGGWGRLHARPCGSHGSGKCYGCLAKVREAVVMSLSFQICRAQISKPT